MINTEAVMTRVQAEIKACQRGAAEKVFGLERMTETDADPAGPELTEDLAFAIEHISTGPGSSVSRGAQSIVAEDQENTIRQLMWNPTGAWQGGFGDTGEWDHALARLWPLRQETMRSIRRWGRYVLQEANEGLFVARDGRAMVHRYRQVTGSQEPSKAYKLATTEEVEHGLDIIRAIIQADREDPLPIMLEVGPGLDPAISGRRRFDNKRYIGVDLAEGAYESDLGNYPEAVRALVSRLDAEARANGSNIEIVDSDVRGLNLPDGSVREVFLGNVLNSPTVSIQDIHDIIGKTQQLLEHNGIVVARVNWHTDLWSAEVIAGLLRMHGLSKVAILKPEEAGHTYLDKLYGLPSNVEAPEGGFYVVATAKKAEAAI